MIHLWKCFGLRIDIVTIKLFSGMNSKIYIVNIMKLFLLRSNGFIWLFHISNFFNLTCRNRTSDFLTQMEWWFSSLRSVIFTPLKKSFLKIIICLIILRIFKIHCITIVFEKTGNSVFVFLPDFFLLPSTCWHYKSLGAYLRAYRLTGKGGMNIYLK